MKHRSKYSGRAAVFGIALLALGALAALADDSGQATRAVRLSDVEGQVTISQNGQPLADHALANMPLFEGTQIVTGDDGRAEIQFENGAVARIPPDSSMTLTVLQQDDTEIDLNNGEGYFELEGTDQDHPTRIRFGSNVVTVNGFTVFRVQLDQPPGSLAVFSGNAHLEAAGDTALDLHGGESADLAQYNLAESIEPDSWDAWNSDRDQAISSADATSTAATNSMPNSNNPAWGDLNQYGSWYNTPDQGYVWSPYDASNPDWDPYGYGSWVDEPSYGYVWVSGYPWGYMPYQCGAWNYYSGFGWGWAPGAGSPWWAGGAGWYFNYGHYPGWYHRPFRPRVGPRPGPVGPHHPFPGHPVGGEPIIAVNRRMPVTGRPVLPPRNRATPVTIGGSVVQPLGFAPRRQSFARNTMAPRYTPVPRTFAPRPGAPSRPVYARPPETGRNTFAPQRPPDNRPVYTPYSQQPGAHPPYNNPSRPAPVYRPPSGGGNPHPTGGGSHPSGGGSHPSGGGSHPTGGGFHPSGGGGHPSGGGSHGGGGPHR
ncbi:MAG TPA: DUF6600 domain-containing protein [Terracidiphilus sp.]|nr:DUF6600 domain-containing protein [Terracidiphilus sp.]